MGRGVADFCFLCGSAPCTCVKPGRKKATTARAKPATPPTPPPATMPQEPTQEPRTPPKPARPRVGLANIKGKPSIRPASPVTRRELPTRANLANIQIDHELEAMRSAVTCIAAAGLLDADEIQKHKQYIDFNNPQVAEILRQGNNA